MKIKPGIGIGDIRYGMKEDQVILHIGKPERTKKSEYIEGSGDWYIDSDYFKIDLSFTYDSDDEYKLGTITINGKGYKLFGRDLYGARMSSVKSFITIHTNEIPVYEDESYIEGSSHELLTFDTIGIMFWFDDGFLSQMQCSYLFYEDGNTVKWPEQS